MNVSELEKELKALGVPSDYYSILLGGTPNECLCLVKTNSETWQVYYSERGEKNGIREFETEQDACLYMLKKLKKYEKNN